MPTGNTLDNDLLIKTATTVDLLNTRLFGGDGQIGAIPYMFEQHKQLTEKLDGNKEELLEKINIKKDELVEKIEEIKKDTDVDIKEVMDKHDKLNSKVTWYAGGITALWSALGLWFGFHKG
jgi:hypothetical protein